MAAAAGTTKGEGPACCPDFSHCLVRSFDWIQLSGWLVYSEVIPTQEAWIANCLLLVLIRCRFITEQIAPLDKAFRSLCKAMKGMEKRCAPKLPITPPVPAHEFE